MEEDLFGKCLVVCGSVSLRVHQVQLCWCLIANGTKQILEEGAADAFVAVVHGVTPGSLGVGPPGLGATKYLGVYFTRDGKTVCESNRQISAASTVIRVQCQAVVVELSL